MVARHAAALVNVAAPPPPPPADPLGRRESIHMQAIDLGGSAAREHSPKTFVLKARLRTKAASGTILARAAATWQPAAKDAPPVPKPYEMGFGGHVASGLWESRLGKAKLLCVHEGKLSFEVQLRLRLRSRLRRVVPALDAF